jgi:putative tricarboxylic transport membrane protein
MKVRITTDLLTGVLFVALGAFAIIYGSRYALGTASRMGAGYFPLLISCGLLLIGAFLVARALLGGGEALGAIGWRPLILVLAGVLAFGLLIDRLGLLAAGVLLVLAARAADRGFGLFETALLAVGLSLAAAAIFIYGLGLPIKLLRL